MQATILEARNLNVFYKTHCAIRSLHVCIGRGELIGLIGPPESGKTTLLKVLAGLLPCKADVLRLSDAPALAQSTPAWRARFGFAFQNLALFDALTTFDNVAFALRRRNVFEDEVLQRVNAALREVNLYDARMLYPATLSGGMRRRVGLARAMVVRPLLGLYDDPIAGLDPESSRQILALLRACVDAGDTSAVVASNDLRALLPVCDRAIMLIKGAIVYDGPFALAYQSSHPAVRQFFSGADEGPL